jgi:hypothetical protein
VEQERFFERGLRAGKLPEDLRGQAREAGAETQGGNKSMQDPEIEAALQRAKERVSNDP